MAYRDRAGVVIELRDESGEIGIGEASPLPEYAGGSVDAVMTGLVALSRKLLGRSAHSLAMDKMPSSLDGPSGAALSCGFQTACMDLGSRQTTRPAAAWLAELTGQSPPNSVGSIPINGILDAAEPAEAAKQARGLVDRGFQAVKIKVGGTLEVDVARIEAVRKAVGETIELRIDANGGWDVVSARSALAAAEALGVTLCEQPVSHRDVDVLAVTAALRTESEVALALDESCRSVEELQAAIRADAADAIILKPMMTGLVQGARMVATAVTNGLGCIVTASFDTSIGTAAAAQLARLLPEPAPPCGLSTVSMLAGDLVTEPLQVGGAVLTLSDAPGLGVSLDEAAVETWATGPWQQT